jgi:hypothetical protein
MTTTERIERAVGGGTWLYDRKLCHWREMSSDPLPNGLRTRRYVVREPRGLVLYDSSEKWFPGKVI